MRWENVRYVKSVSYTHLDVYKRQVLVAWKTARLFADRYDTEKMTTDELKTIIWRYFTSYWNNRRICSTNGGLPPMIKRQQYYDSRKEAA